MALKEWFVANGVFDKNLLLIFPRYGINDPEQDLKNLTPSQWKEIKTEQLRERASELNSSAAKLRHTQKFTKIEKLWKLSRAPPKKKRRSQKSKSLAGIKKKSKRKSSKTKLDEIDENKPSTIHTKEIENLRKKNKDIEKERLDMLLEFNLCKKVHKTKLDQVNHEKMALNKEWEGKYNTKEIEFREIQKVYNKYKQMNYDHNHKRITIEAQIKDLTETNDKLKEINADLQERVTRNTMEMEETNQKYTELEIKHRLIRDEKQTFDAKQNELRDDMHQVKDYNTLLKANLAEMEHKNKEMKDSVEHHKAALDESDTKLTLKVKEFNHLQIKYGEVLDDYEQLRNECDLFQNECSQLKIELKQAKAAAKEGNNTNDHDDTALKQEIEGLNELVKRLEKEIEREKENENENEDIKHAYNKIKRKYDILYESTQQNAEYDMNELVQENKRLRVKVKKGQRTATLDDIIQTLDNENVDEKLDSLRNERDTLRDLCNEMRIFIEANQLTYTNHKDRSRSKSKTKMKKQKSKDLKLKSKDSKPKPKPKPKSKTESKARPRTESKVKKKHKQKDENIVPETYLTAFD